MQAVFGFNFSPEPDAESGWASKLIKFQKEFSVRHQSYVWPLVTEQGVYFPGPIWRRLDPDTGSMEVVTPKPLSSEWNFDEYAVSGPFGLVAWNRGDKLYRVHVKSNPSEEPAREERYPFVPVDQRVRHHHAVTRLRDLGAIVGDRLREPSTSGVTVRNGSPSRGFPIRGRVTLTILLCSKTFTTCVNCCWSVLRLPTGTARQSLS